MKHINKKYIQLNILNILNIFVLKYFNYFKMDINREINRNKTKLNYIIKQEINPLVEEISSPLRAKIKSK